MAKTESPWPKKGNKLFLEEGDVNKKAFHLPSFIWRNLEHAGAFKVAADIVIDSYKESNHLGHGNELLHPVAYLYRHALELKLKEIVRYGIELGCYGRADVDGILADHNLAKLWAKAKKVITHRWPQGEQAPVKAVEAVINEMHQTDNNGQKWRYGSEKNGQPNRHEGLPEYVSHQSLRETMNNTFTFLDCCESGIGTALQDMRSEMY